MSFTIILSSNQYDPIAKMSDLFPERESFEKYCATISSNLYETKVFIDGDMYSSMPLVA